MPIFIQTKDEKFHIAELYHSAMTCYHGDITEGIIPFTKGLVYRRQVDLPNHIKLCGVCLRHYLLTWEGRERV